ncbi:DUF6691 family protein [Aliagarivorans taiwanensis]|uniref:DUF6691 family protein n=1 Tax=Aliagarivorans taiwanensis TaxID=561966 RepID=UPI00040C9E0B|nr:DUF6691 family protein [Aliagarivorans taiwanensis]
MNAKLIALLCGVVFGLGMMISGMVNPNNVLGFLTLSASWNPSLAFVMGGALAVFIPAYQWLIKPRVDASKTALTGQPLQLPANKQIDGKLLAGASLFGIGWGVAGICPGPGLTMLISGQPPVWVFFVSMLAAMFAYQRLIEPLSRATKSSA